MLISHFADETLRERVQLQRQTFQERDICSVTTGLQLPNIFFRSYWPVRNQRAATQLYLLH